jgi:hypothetical protein
MMSRRFYDKDPSKVLYWQKVRLLSQGTVISAVSIPLSMQLYQDGRVFFRRVK